MRTSARAALVTSFALILTGLSFASPSFGAIANEPVVAPDASQVGPFAVATGEYKFPSKIDKEVLPTEETELWARVFWPKQLGNERHPILFFLHGNHATCEDRSTAPPYDDHCGYTYNGTCPDGMTVVPNHEGYNYLGEHLASWGYIVVSINANRGITCGSGVGGDSGLILARGRLVLRHIEQWFNWTTKGGSPANLGLPADSLKGSVDFGNVGLFGHSRGGEGVRAAYNLYRETGSEWPKRMPGVEFRGIYEIGAVDGMSSRVLDADDTAWNQLLPLCDGDVADLAGRKPFERMILKRHETRKTPKSLFMVWGTNHNFYNTEWQSSDAHGCFGHEPIYGKGPVSLEQQKIALENTTAFFRAHVGAHREPSFAENFDPLFALPSSITSTTKVHRAFILTNDEDFSARVEDFDKATGMNTSGNPNQASGIEILHEKGSTPKNAVVTWTAAGSDKFLQVNWTADGVGKSIASFDTLDFRIGRHSTQYQDKVPTDFSVQLVDSAGNRSKSVAISRFVEVLGPVNLNALYQTVRIPLREFGWPATAQLHGVRFNFDISPASKIKLAHVRLTSGEITQLLASLSSPLPALEPQDNSQWLDNENENSNEFGAKILIPGLPGGPKVEVSKAEVTGVRVLASSRYMNGRPVVEIAVHAADKFKADMNLPTLLIEGHAFTVSRYPQSGSLDTLIFSVPREDFDKLPSTGKMRVQYGKSAARKIWKMADFDKESLKP